MKVAFVVQRYGLEVHGGSETLCRALAERMARYWQVEVITTCALDYISWKDHYPHGREHLHGVDLWRFPVDYERRTFRFALYSRWLRHFPSSLEAQEKWMRLQGPFSTPLLNFLKEKKQFYDRFVFFTYLYPTTYFGLPLVKDKAIMVPTAHDEPWLGLPLFQQTFSSPRAIAYCSPEERDLVIQRFNNSDLRHQVIGVGMNSPEGVDGERFRARYGLEGPFLLYMGRWDKMKGCEEMLEFFTRFIREHGTEMKLVLMGRGPMKVPSHPAIVPLGFLTEGEKFSGLKEALALWMPSTYESLSLATLEAWLMRTPVLAQRRCRVLSAQCQRSQAGILYSRYEEFAEGLLRLLREPSLRHEMGQKGHQFVKRNYDWEEVESKFKALVEA